MNITFEVMENLATYMNDDIRESLHGANYETYEKFLREYLIRDPEFSAILKCEFKEIYDAICKG